MDSQGADANITPAQWLFVLRVSIDSADSIFIHQRIVIGFTLTLVANRLVTKNTQL
jgi:hypothetical protein